MATADNNHEVLYTTPDHRFTVIGILPPDTAKSIAGKLAQSGFKARTPRASVTVWGGAAVVLLKEFRTALRLCHNTGNVPEFHSWLDGWAASLENRPISPTVEPEVIDAIGRL